MAALALLLGCIPAHAAPIPTLPPYTQAYEPQDVDERGLWMQLDEAERQLRDSAFIIRDAALNGYVRSVLCRTVGADRCATVRVYIMRNAEFNATMAPNGMMMVYSGLLLRVHDEAELGAVLGHEFGHFEKRHTLNRFKRRRTAGDIISWTGILAPTIYSSTVVNAAGALASYKRAEEQEADLIGLAYLAASPYPAASAANIWERMMAEADATAAGRKRKSHTRRYSSGFFDSHPTDLTRATYLRAEALKANDPGVSGAVAYHAALAPWLPIFLADQIKLNDFGGTDYLLGQLAGDEWSADLLYARAELYRQRGNPRDLVSAASFYGQAIDKGCTDPEAERGMGLALLRSQQADAGKSALRRYLARKPDAQDAMMIAALIAK